MTLGADRGVPRIIAIIVFVMGRGGVPRRAHPMARTARPIGPLSLGGETS